MEQNRIKDLNEFTVWHTSDIWVILLDGRPMRGYVQNAFNTKAGANKSLSHSLKYTCKQYGFNKPGDMRKALEDYK